VKIKIGEGFNAPPDKHSEISYKLKQITEQEIVVTYSSEFDARSFGGQVTTETGEFKLKIEKKWHNK